MKHTDIPFRIVEQGTGQVVPHPGSIRLLRSSTTDQTYANAQICDPDKRAIWRPPLTMTVRARFSHPAGQLRGTAGFGFWNAGVGPKVPVPRPPQAVWYFFGGAPYNVPVAMGVPGNGFKAAVLDAMRLPFFALLPVAPIGVLLMRIPMAYRRLWPIAQRAIGASEASLDSLDLTVPHTYTLRWDHRGVAFAVDDRIVLTTPDAPRGPLRFVTWIDNSYAVATPQGRFGYGLVAAADDQWLDLYDVVLLASARSAVIHLD